MTREDKQAVAIILLIGLVIAGLIGLVTVGVLSDRLVDRLRDCEQDLTATAEARSACEQVKQECQATMPAKATAAARTQLDAEYRDRFNAVFGAHCGRAECERQWYDSVHEREDIGDGRRRSRMVWTGPVGCTQPGEVPWIQADSWVELTCLPDTERVAVQTPEAAP